jgi:ribosomal protein L20
MENTYSISFVDMKTKKRHSRIYDFDSINSAAKLQGQTDYQQIIEAIKELLGHEEINVIDFNYIPENYTISCGTV